MVAIADGLIRLGEAVLAGQHASQTASSRVLTCSGVIGGRPAERTGASSQRLRLASSLIRLSEKPAISWLVKKGPMSER